MGTSEVYQAGLAADHWRGGRGERAGGARRLRAAVVGVCDRVEHDVEAARIGTLFAG